MISGSPRNVGASVRARLLNRSRETGDEFQSLLRRYAAERFLYRLGQSRHRGRYVLKGGMLLALWGDTIYRPTRDLDFTGEGDSSGTEIASTVKDICAVQVPDDGITFDTSSLTVEPIHEEGAYQSHRARFEATVAKARVRMQIDFGFGDSVYPHPTEVDFPVLLEAPRPRIRVYSREAVVAEKVHAMVVNGDRNSRYKDFYDIFTLARHFPFEGPPLTTAVRTTFKRRRTPFAQTTPIALTPEFYQDPARVDRWQGYVNRTKLRDPPSHFADVGETVLSFLRQPWDALAHGSEFIATWAEGGPWRHADSAAARTLTEGGQYADP